MLKGAIVIGISVLPTWAGLTGRAVNAVATVLLAALAAIFVIPSTDADTALPAICLSALTVGLLLLLAQPRDRAILAALALVVLGMASAAVPFATMIEKVSALLFDQALPAGSLLPLVTAIGFCATIGIAHGQCFAGFPVAGLGAMLVMQGKPEAGVAVLIAAIVATIAAIGFRRTGPTVGPAAVKR